MGLSVETGIREEFATRLGVPTSPAAVAVAPKSAVMGKLCRKRLFSTAISNAGTYFQ